MAASVIGTILSSLTFSRIIWPRAQLGMSVWFLIERRYSLGIDPALLQPSPRVRDDDWLLCTPMSQTADTHNALYPFTHTTDDQSDPFAQASRDVQCLFGTFVPPMLPAFGDNDGIRIRGSRVFDAFATRPPKFGIDNTDGSLSDSSGDFDYWEHQFFDTTRICSNSIDLDAKQAPSRHSLVGGGGDCSCISCLRVGNQYTYTDLGTQEFLCRVPGCQWSIDAGSVGWKACKTHEKSHFSYNGRFSCAESHCGFGTTRWPDLTRHYTSRHCKTPSKYSCHVLGCKYGGDNGFIREDKLRSHYKNVHT